MQHKFGWAAAALAMIVTLFPLPGRAENPRVILGKRIELHYKKTIKTTEQGLFVPTQSFETHIMRHHLRFREDGDMAFVDLSSAANAFDRDHGTIYRLGQHMNFLVTPDRMDQTRFLNANYSYWIGGAAFDRNILLITGRMKFVDKRSGTETIADARMTIAVSPDGKKCELRSLTQRIASSGLMGKIVVDVSLLYQMSCRIKRPFELDDD